MTLDTGHGWITARPDGYLAKCGGPRICSTCQKEAFTLQTSINAMAAAAAALSQREEAAKPPTGDVRHVTVGQILEANVNMLFVLGFPANEIIAAVEEQLRILKHTYW